MKTPSTFLNMTLKKLNIRGVRWSGGLLALIGWMAAEARLHAQATWTGATSADWSVGTNWSGTPPVSSGTSDLIFTGTTNPITNNDLTSLTASSILFDNSSTGGVFTLGGNALTLGGNITTLGATGTPTHTISLDLILNGDRVLNTALDNNLLISGVISGSGFGLTKQGDGQVTLSGINTFTGVLQVDAGKLRAESNVGALGAGTLTLNGGTLELANDGNLNFARPTTVAVDTTIISNSLTLNQSTTHTLGALTIGNQTLTTVRGDVITGTLTGNVTFSSTTLTGNAIFNPTTRSTLRLGAVNDGGNGYTLTASGSGTGATVHLVGAGAWSGGTVLNSGTLRVDSADGLGANGVSAAAPTVTTVNGGVLQLRNINAARNNRRIDFQGNSTLQFVMGNNSTNIMNIGELVHSAGNLTIQGLRATTGQTPTIILQEDLTMNNGNLNLGALNVGTVLIIDSVISEAAGTTKVTIVDSASDSADTGTVALARVNTYSGDTDIDQGGLRLDIDNALPFGAGKGNFIFSPELATEFATLDLNGHVQTINGLSNSGLGTITIDNTSASAASLTIGANDGTGTFSGTIQDSGAGALSIAKTGSGLITLNGTGAYVGSTSVDGGVLAVQPSVLATTTAVNVGTTSAGTLAFDPDGTGSEMVLAAGTNLNLGGASSAGELVFQLGADTATSDRITLSGAGTLTVGAGGGLISAVNLGTLAAGSYDVVSGPNAVVGGSNLGLGSLPGGFTYGIDTTTDPTKVTLIAAAVAAGDLFWTGDVDASWATLLSGDSNWSTDASGATNANYTPGVDSTVNFSATSAGTGPFVTTLDNFYSVAGINVLTGVGSVTVNTGVAGGFNVTANQDWDVADASSELVVNANIAGAANLTKTGSGALTLTGANTLAGDLVLDSGTLNLNSAGASGTGTLVINGGTLDNTSGAAVISTGNNPQTWNGDFTFTGSNDLDLGTGLVTLAGDRTVTVDAGTLAVQGITGAFGLTKEGAGILDVGPNGDYTGATLVNDGVLQASGTNSFSANSAYTVAAGALLRINNTSQVIGSLAGAGTVENGGGTGTDTLTVGGDNSDTVFSGVLQDGATGFLAVTKVGTGMMTLSGSSSTLTGNVVVNGGILNITGDLDNVSGGTGAADTHAGIADNSTGMIYLASGASLTTDSMALGNAATRNGSLVVDGGDLTLTTPTTSAGLSHGNGGYGGIFLQDGSITLNRIDASNLGGGSSVLRVDGGTLTSNEFILFRNLNSEFTVTGGQVLHNNASQNISLNYQNGGTTVMTVAGGLVDNTGKAVTFGQASTSAAGYVGVLNLTGGNLITNQITSTVRGASSSTINFNGGTLTAAINETNFLSDAAGLAVYLHAAGGTIDTAGSNVTISAPLLAPTGDGVSSLSVTAAGSGYIGAPYVEITGGGGTGATGYAVVDLDPLSATFGQVTDVVISNPGTGYTSAPTINLLGGGGSGAVIAAGALTANVSGGLSKVGSGTLTLSGQSTYTGLTSVTGGTLAYGINDALADGAVTIDSGASVDMGTFTDTVGQVTLIDGNISGSGGTLTSTADFDLQSGTVSANLAGAVGIDKSTAGTVTLSGTNTFSGDVSITGGVLEFSDATHLGDGSATNLISIDGGTLSYTGITTATLAANQAITVGAGGATVDTAFAAGTLEVTGGISSSVGGDLTKTGPGTLTVSGTTDLSGGNLTVSQGVFNGGLATNGIGTIDIATGGTLNLFDGAATTVNVSGLTLADGSSVGFDLGAPGTNDLIALTGTASDTGTIALNFTDLGGLAVGTYDLITATSGGLDATYILGSAPAGLNFTFSTPGNNIVRLTTSSLALRYWQGDVDGSWSTNVATNTNWATDDAGTTDLGALPGAGDTLVFSTTNATGPSISTTLDGSFTVDGLQFSPNPTGVTNVTIAQGSGGTLTLAPASSNNGIFIDDNGGLVTISAPLVAGAAQTWSVTGTGANGSALNITGDVDFANAVTKTGDGLLTLTGANTGAGGLTVNGGTLEIGSDTAVGTGTFTTGAGITLDAVGGARTLTNNNLIAVNGSFTFTGTNDLDLGMGAVTLGNNAVVTVAASTLTIGGDINDGGNAFALTKSGAGTMELNGTNTFSGGVTLAEGTLNLGNASALGTGSFTIGLGTTLDNTSGAALTLSTNNPQTWQGGFTFTGTDDLNLGTGAVLMDAPTNVNVVAGTLTVGGVIDDGANANALTKSGAGTLLLSGVNTYDGRTLIDEGTLELGVDDALPALTVVRLGTGATAGTLDLAGHDQTIAGLLAESETGSVTNQIIIDAGNTLTVNGAVTLGADAIGSTATTASVTNVTATGGGSLVVNTGGSNFQVGGSSINTNGNSANVDFSGLSNFTADLGLGTFKVGDVTSISTSNTPTSTLRLAENNTITAGTIAIGEGTPPQNLGDPHSLILGSGTNVLNANVIAVGSGLNNNRSRSSGEIVFDPADTTGTLTIRGSDGVSAAQTLHMVNSTATTGNSISATMDLTGHTVDVLVADVNMARRTAGNGNATATLSFDQGRFELVDDLVMAHRVTSGTGNATATINVGGGDFIIGDDTTMSLNTGSDPASITTATINVTDGTMTFGDALIMANATGSQIANSTINLTGGVTTVGGNVTVTGDGTKNATVNLDGGTLDMTAGNIGGGGVNGITFLAQSGTLMNLNQLNGGGTLEKTSSGTLILEGTNNYSGPTVITDGTLQVGTGGTTGTLGTNTGELVNNGTLAVNRSDAVTVPNIISGTGSLRQIGDGTTTLTGASTYTGVTSVEAGTLQLGDGGATGSLSTSSAITINAGATLAVNQSDVTVQGTDFSSAAITGAGNFVQEGSGRTVLTAANTYSGTTAVTAGSLQVGSAGVGTTGTGAVSVDSGAALLGSGTVRGSDFTLSNGATLYAGDTTLTNDFATLDFTPATGGGTQDIQGSLILGISTPNNEGSVDPLFGGNAVGTAGYYTYINDVSRSSGLGAGTHDLLSFNQADDTTAYDLNFLTSTGTLTVEDNAFTPMQGQIFNLLDWALSVNANFSGFNVGSNYRDGSADDMDPFNLPDISGSGLFWDVSQFTTTGIVVVVPEPARASLLVLGLSAFLLRRRRR
ncbi:MAG: autotransporter-associated beta strand repeat-containing protein [Verrucomicrobiales bacterium]|nr:autotransporter-associated beta strand repeat-containing protein [Verrucomicrobiales bacterium]